jgi:hypothetical protein
VNDDAITSKIFFIFRTNLRHEHRHGATLYALCAPPSVHSVLNLYSASLRRVPHPCGLCKGASFFPLYSIKTGDQLFATPPDYCGSAPSCFNLVSALSWIALRRASGSVVSDFKSSSAFFAFSRAKCFCPSARYASDRLSYTLGEFG